MVIQIARKKKKGKPSKKPAGTYICKFCGKTLKTERGLAGHEKKCGSVKELEPDSKLAPETMEIFGIPKDEDAGVTAEPGEVEGEDTGLQEEHDRELDRLKSQYQRLSDEEKRLLQEREALQRERDEFYSDMTKAKPRAAAAVLDPFGDAIEGEDEIPSISGPIATEPAGKAKGEVEEFKQEDLGVSEAEMDLSARTKRLKKELKDRSKAAEPEDTFAEPERAVSEGEDIDVISPGPPEDITQVGLPPETELSGEMLFNSIREQIESEFGSRLRRHEAVLDDLQKMVENQNRIVKNIQETMSNLVQKVALENLNKNIQKIDTKVNEMAEEVGFGESLNVSKIPPSILISVYEATLDDAIKALIHNIGPYDMESTILKILEEIRTQTSGSELFKFEEGKLKIKELARNLENKTISAKQIQATYSELLKKIVDYSPGYKPKNFRAMLKIKSQEYAVDRAATLADVLSKINKDLQEVKMTNQDINDRLVDIEEARNTLTSDIRVIEQTLNEINAKIDDIRAGGDSGGEGDELEGEDSGSDSESSDED
ncbi:MAG: hypothetical protein JSV49_10450 [Thermoplasmata archaeon]|nr:MAG: hypothetical protein JSV49_10450 [Thermoplasmata archaeon]